MTKYKENVTIVGNSLSGNTSCKALQKEQRNRPCTGGVVIVVRRMSRVQGCRCRPRSPPDGWNGEVL